MSDLIERDKVAELFKELFEQGALTLIGNDYLQRKLDAIPSARPKGEWIARRPSEKGLGVVYECPFCEYEVDCVPTNFCPNCGADMRGKDDE